MEQAAIQLHGLGKLYGQTIALRPVSLELRSGQILAVLGPNGSGKTTLLKVLAGVVSPTFGSSEIFGRKMSGDRGDPRSQIGFLASETYLYEDLSARENLQFATTMAGNRISGESLDEALDRVGLLANDLSQSVNSRGDRVRSFSAGMKRRLCLARLMLMRPRLWLLDEPYNSLDEDACGLVDDLVRAASAGDGVVVLATHDAERALALADLVLELDRGATTYLGSTTGFSLRHAQHVV